MTIILIPLALAFILIAVIDYRKAFLIVMIVGPLVTTQSLWGSRADSPMQLIFPPVAVGFALAVATRRQNFANLNRELVVLLLAQIGVAIASGFEVRELWHFRTGVINLINMSVVALVCLAFLQSQRDLRNALVAWMISATIAAIVALAEYTGSGGGYALYRAKAFFWNPNYLAAHIATGGLASGGLFLYYSDSRRMKLISAASFIACLVGLPVSLSLGAMLGLISGGAVMGYWFRASLRRHVRSAIMMVIIAAVIMYMINNLSDGVLKKGYSYRIEDHSVGSFQMASRTLHYKVALNILLSKPLLGVGINNYYSTFHSYVPWSSLNDEELFLAMIPRGWVTHNDFLSAIAETGIAGGLLFLIMHVLGVKRAVRTLRQLKRDKERNRFFTLGVTALAMYISTVVFSLTHNYKGLFMYWVPLVMLYALPRLSGAIAIKQPGLLTKGQFGLPPGS